MHQFKPDILTVNLKPYFTNVNKIYNQLTIFSEKIFFFRVNSRHYLKSLSYLGCKIWEELPRNLKDQSYLGAFQNELRDNLLKRQFEKYQAQSLHTTI